MTRTDGRRYGMLNQRSAFTAGRTISARDNPVPVKPFNTCQLLLARCSASCVFVPSRTMQFQGVIERGEINFVDSHDGYAVQNGEGGRPIALA